MHSLVYRSVANASFELPEIYSMLSNAKDYNAEHGITGCLLYHNSQFLQLLEGEKQEVEKLFQKIVKDPRHHDLVVIENDEAEIRLFKTWNMAFHDYGQNGLSANLKLRQIDTFLSESNIFNKKSLPALQFFSNVKEILFAV
ncbi:MAG: BLUF domain-containing protein [Bacteroidota bacterium]